MVKESNFRILGVTKESNWMITECWCGKIIKLKITDVGVMKGSNCIVKECWCDESNWWWRNQISEYWCDEGIRLNDHKWCGGGIKLNKCRMLVWWRNQIEQFKNYGVVRIKLYDYRMFCGGGIKLNNYRMLVWWRNQIVYMLWWITWHIITECWGGGEHEKFCSHKAIKFVCVCLNFLFTWLNYLNNLILGALPYIQQMQHVSLWSELCFFAVLQVHQRAWSIIKYMASNHFSMLGTR